MSEIIDGLKEAARKLDMHGYSADKQMVERAISEIYHLRSLAGGVSQGESFAEIAKPLRAAGKTSEPDKPA